MDGVTVERVSYMRGERVTFSGPVDAVNAKADAYMRDHYGADAGQTAVIGDHAVKVVTYRGCD